MYALQSKEKIENKVFDSTFKKVKILFDEKKSIFTYNSTIKGNGIALEHT